LLEYKQYTKSGQLGIERGAKGREFEQRVYELLLNIFSKVSREQYISGKSGYVYKVDFMCDDSIIIECTLQKKRFDQYFLQFFDMKQAHPDYTFIYLTDNDFSIINSRKKEYTHNNLFPWRSFNVFTSYGFHFITLEDMDKIRDIKSSGYNSTPKAKGNIAKVLEDRMSRVLDVIKANGPCRVCTVAKILGIGQDQARIASEKLLDRGLLFKRHSYLYINEDDYALSIINRRRHWLLFKDQMIGDWILRKIKEFYAKNGYYHTREFCDFINLTYKDKKNPRLLVFRYLKKKGLVRRQIILHGKKCYLLSFHDSNQSNLLDFI
jgi:hypothetical protein